MSARPFSDLGEVGSVDRFLRKRLLKRLEGLRHGTLELVDATGTVVLGVPSETYPRVRLEILDPSFYRALAASGSVGAAEAYMADAWVCSDLVALVRLLVRNRDLLDGMETGSAKVSSWLMRALNAARRNTRAGARKNIAAHYDLGNAFFALFLSEDLMYSSAMFTCEDELLEVASLRKLDVLCEKLRLGPEDHVVEIGSGWGGFAIHAARTRGCRVTTTTISAEQYALAKQRVDAAGLSDRVTVLAQDYRDLEGRYDKLVSIEMIEAIGPQFLDVYFATLDRLLKPGGLALVQAITIEDHRYAQAVRSVDFIKRHVVPGSFIPSIAAMLAAKTRSSHLALIELQDFGLSYARTLKAWRMRFLANIAQVHAQGFDTRFIRLWEFYLAYCEGGFRERSIGVSHLLFQAPLIAPAGRD
jgi:cyclopropane-fatty-acyl-phospholipid synthase